VIGVYFIEDPHGEITVMPNMFLVLKMKM